MNKETIAKYRRWGKLTAVIAVAGVSLRCLGVPVGFRLDPAGSFSPGISGQFSMEVTDAGNHQVLFKISNNGPVASTITEVLFYDGALLGISSLSGSAGVSFTKGAPFHPLSLPRYPEAKFGVDENTRRGVSYGIDNTGEWLGVLFNLKRGYSFQDLLNELRGGKVFVGLRVQQIGRYGFRGGEWYRSVCPSVPDGGLTVTLLGLAVLGLAGLRRALVRS
jgi:hypothetical protein